MYLTGVEAKDGKIIESYEAYCSDKPYSEVTFGTSDAICRSFTVIQE
jgi:hypothetical protein